MLEKNQLYHMWYISISHNCKSSFVFQFCFFTFLHTCLRSWDAEYALSPWYRNSVKVSLSKNLVQIMVYADKQKLNLLEMASWPGLRVSFATGLCTDKITSIYYLDLSIVWIDNDFRIHRQNLFWEVILFYIYSACGTTAGQV